MSVEVYEHAIDRYTHRIFGMEEEEVTDLDRVVAEKEILGAVKYPDRVVHEEKDKPQIHIKRNAAVIVGVESEDGETYKMYDTLDDEIVVPSVYNASTFGGASDDDQERART